MDDYSRDPQLDDLVRQLNSEPTAGESSDRPTVPAQPAPTARSVPSGPPAIDPLDASSAADSEVGEELATILAHALAGGASDLLLVGGLPPVIRIDGALKRLPAPPLAGEEIWGLLRGHLSARGRRAYEERGAADFSLRLTGSDGGRRFRVNLHRQRGAPAAALRVLPQRVPRIEDLQLPVSLGELADARSGLLLVCGPAGSGKTTTLAALVGEINGRRPCHIVTLEDPIEYEHRAERAVVEQIEIGRDSPSFAEALRAALRQDPEVILVGEIRDLETMTTALSAAETGHLILASLHTRNAVQAVHRIVDVYPAAAQGQIRQQLATSLRAIVCQQLVPRQDGAGRVPAVELLLSTVAVRNHIRNERAEKLTNELVLGKRLGMISMEDSLAGWVRAGVIDAAEARLRSSRPEEFDSLLAGH
ncbi:MAG: PilT/PilU family type 4a pilus ATPase [Acidobacteriota bacterium]